MPIQSRIAGTGMNVPDNVVTNDDLAKMMTTSDDWIVQRSGIRERRHALHGMGPTEIAVPAVKRAMEMAECKIEDIDCIVTATLSPEHYFPGTGFTLQRDLEAGTTPVIDIRAQCSGFIYALQVADSFIKSGLYKKVAVVGVELQSHALEFADRGRDMAVLFGDGAGAVILEATETDAGVLSTHIWSQGKHVEKLWLEYPATKNMPAHWQEALDEGRQYPKMEGRVVFKHACTRMPQAIMTAMAHNNLLGDDVDMFFFHQANLRINEMIAKIMDIPKEKSPYNIDKYGNCSAASIPMLLDEQVRSGKFKRGDIGVMTAFGAGFSWGSAAVRF